MPALTAQNISVRRLAEEDQQRLEEMYDTFEPQGVAMGLPPRQPLPRRQWLAGLRHGINLVAFVDGSLAGHLALLPEGRTAEMACFVHQDFRRRGVATALTRTAVKEARTQGLSAIWVFIDSSNLAARRGLIHFGFRVAWEDLQEAQFVFPLREKAERAA